MNRVTSLGWIGLGRMGAALAERLAGKGHDIAGYNRTRAKVEHLSQAGIGLVDRPVDLAGRDVVFTMVSTAKDLMAVLSGEGGLLSGESKPSVLVDLSTISPEASEEVRQLLADHGVAMLVLPVSGNDVVARAGKLSVIASGPRAVYESIEPILADFGSDLTYVGDGDISRIIKICHNLILGLVYQGLAETALLAEKHGVPRHLYLEVINRSVMGSIFSRYKSPVIANLDFTVTFTNTLMLKDFDLGMKSAAQHGVSLPATQAARLVTEEMVRTGRGEEDFTAVLDLLAKRAGMTLVPEEVDIGDGLD